MTQGSIDRAKKTLNRMKFGENLISNSEYNMFMNILTESEEKIVGLLCHACKKARTTMKNRVGQPLCIDCSH